MGNKKPEAVSPWGDWDYKTYNVEDLAIGTVRFDNGATLSIEASFAAHIETSSSNIVIMGDKGGCSLRPAKIFTDQNGYMFNMTPEHIKPQDHFEFKMAHFIDCIRTGKPSDAPGVDGLVVQKMLRLRKYGQAGQLSVRALRWKCRRLFKPPVRVTTWHSIG